MNIRIRSTDKLGNKAFICQRDDGKWYCMLADRTPAAFSYAGIDSKSEAELTFALEACQTGEQALATVKRFCLANHYYTFELVTPETPQMVPQKSLLATQEVLATAMERVEQLAQRLIDLAEGARSKASLLASKSPTSAYTNPVTVLRALAKEAEDGLVEGAPRARLEERLSAITREAQEAGYAITWWAPASVEGIDVEAMLDVAIQRGNDYISDNAPDPEVLEKSGLRKVIEQLVANGWVLSYVDNGEDAVHSKSIEEAVEDAAAVEQAWIHFIKNDGTPARATGYLMLVWGNSPIELIADYGYQEGNGFAEAVEAAQRSVWPNYPDED